MFRCAFVFVTRVYAYMINSSWCKMSGQSQGHWLCAFTHTVVAQWLRALRYWSDGWGSSPSASTFSKTLNASCSSCTTSCLTLHSDLSSTHKMWNTKQEFHCKVDVTNKKVFFKHKFWTCSVHLDKQDSWPWEESTVWRRIGICACTSFIVSLYHCFV